MKKLTLTILSALALTSAAFAGPDTYVSKETNTTAVQPVTEWYANNEWNASIWGTYAFTGTESADDRYLGVDHAWGGGLDFKYFMARYFGFGIEGYALDAHDAVGTALGTFTLRYPVPGTRFSPYAFLGGGVIFNGTRIDETIDSSGTLREVRENSDARGIGQFGGGLEFRLTPHVGLMQDFSWNVVDGPENNFGMVRAGITFAF